MRFENLFEKNKIRTFTGIYIDPFNPKPDEIYIEDIAHALAQTPRWSGHLKRFYSVADHSIRVSELVSLDVKLQALLHDASEAYLNDIPTPIKHQIPKYKEIEENLMHVIAKRFGFEWPACKEVKEADTIALHEEWNDRMILDTKFESDIRESERKFLSIFNELK